MNMKLDINNERYIFNFSDLVFGIIIGFSLEKYDPNINIYFHILYFIILIYMINLWYWGSLDAFLVEKFQRNKNPILEYLFLVFYSFITIRIIDASVMQSTDDILKWVLIFYIIGFISDVFYYMKFHKIHSEFDKELFNILHSFYVKIFRLFKAFICIGIVIFLLCTDYQRDFGLFFSSLVLVVLFGELPIFYYRNKYVLPYLRKK